MIPLGDDNPTRTKPYVIYVLIALNVLVFLAQQTGLFNNLSMIPASVLRDQRYALLFNPMGQIAGYRPMDVGPHPQWITIFTSMFMHGSWMHIIGNMLYLWIFGNNIEDVLGHVKFAFFYIICGVLAAFSHIYSGPESMIPTVGASGAIAGVLGAYIVLYPNARIKTLIMLWFFWDYVQIPAFYVLGVWFLTQLTGTFGTGGQIGGGVAYWAHIGGFIAGAILILILGGRSRARRRRSYLSPYDNKPYPWRRWN